MKNKFTRKVLRSKKGFTLAELLIVIGIIAVLAAIAIPVFTNAIKKAEEAVEVANARAVYGEGMVAYITDETKTLSKTIDGKLYAFTYTPAEPEASPAVEEKWEISIESETGKNVKVYNSTITDFSKIDIDGK